MSDSTIPTLTEVLGTDGDAPDALPGSLEHVEWAALTQRVRDDVLERLLRDSDAKLARSLHETLEPLLARAIEQLGDELRDRVSRVVHELVSDAVAEEITTLHDEIERRSRTRGPL